MESMKQDPKRIYADLEKWKGDYAVYENGEDMAVMEHRGRGGMYMVNHRTREAWLVKTYYGDLVAWTTADVDMKSLEGVKNTGYARNMVAAYGFHVGGFRNGMALVSWTLQPEGSYYADEDGFGMTDDEEVKVYGVVDSSCRMRYPFTLKSPKEVWELAMNAVTEGKTNIVQTK